MKIPLFILTMCLAVSACGTPEVPVRARWSESVSNYGIVPVYPMREDVFIGDIRIHNRLADDYSLNSRLLGNLPLEDNVIDRERGRPVYPRTTTPPTNDDDTPVSFAQPTGSLGPDGEANRLRLAALPRIDAARFTSADVGGSGGAGLWNVIVGGAAESSSTLILSLTGIETLELPDTVVVPAFYQFLRAQLASDDAFTQAVCHAALSYGADFGENTLISIVSRVLYARAIEYIYGDDLGAALRAAAGDQRNSALDIAPVSSPGEETEGEPPAPPTIDLASITPGAPGVSARISAASRNGLSLLEVYERPLAFGVQAVFVNPFELRPDLPVRCEGLGFVPSPLDELLPGGISLDGGLQASIVPASQ